MWKRLIYSFQNYFYLLGEADWDGATFATARLRRIVGFFAQSAFPLLSNFNGILTGIVLALFINALNSAPWTLILYPQLLTVRGVIGGILSGCLTTGLHIGTIRPTILEGELFRLFAVVLSLTLIGSLFVFVLGGFASLYLIGAASWMPILLIVVAVMTLSLLLIFPVTLTISFISYRRGLDPDFIVYPSISCLTDLIVTFLYGTILLVYFGDGGQLLLAVDLTFVFLVLGLALLHLADAEFRRNIFEALISILATSMVATLTGIYLREIELRISGEQSVYRVYPAMIGTVGSVGAVLGSTYTTKLFIGEIEARLRDLRNIRMEIIIVWIASLMMFVVYSIIGLIGLPWSLNGQLGFTLKLILTNLISIPAVILLSLSISIVTYKRGLNPDVFVIPIETTMADLITTFTLSRIYYYF